MLLIVLALASYFLLATALLALVVMPSFRAATWSRCRQCTLRFLGWWQRNGQTSRRLIQLFAYRYDVIIQYVSRHFAVYIREIVIAALLLTVLPIGALAWRHWYALETFDHTDVYVKDERVAALLAGERLTPPAPLPPDVFMTREVTLALPLVRFASRDWMLLDEEFRQRVLMVYRIMREQHGYDMVLLEGYRSPERQAQLASLGGHVTQAGPGRSYHQHGLAVDSAFLRNGKVVISEQDPWAMRGYELYGQTAALLGLTWGGSWKSLADYGHVELRRPGVLRSAAGGAGSSAP